MRSAPPPAALFLRKEPSGSTGLKVIPKKEFTGLAGNIYPFVGSEVLTAVVTRVIYSGI
jgi:hypothetical protein